MNRKGQEGETHPLCTVLSCSLVEGYAHFVGVDADALLLRNSLQSNKLMAKPKAMERHLIAQCQWGGKATRRTRLMGSASSKSCEVLRFDFSFLTCWRRAFAALLARFGWNPSAMASIAQGGTEIDAPFRLSPPAYCERRAARPKGECSLYHYNEAEMEAARL